MEFVFLTSLLRVTTRKCVCRHVYVTACTFIGPHGILEREPLLNLHSLDDHIQGWGQVSFLLCGGGVLSYHNQVAKRVSKTNSETTKVALSYRIL